MASRSSPSNRRSIRGRMSAAPAAAQADPFVGMSKDEKLAYLLQRQEQLDAELANLSVAKQTVDDEILARELAGVDSDCRLVHRREIEASDSQRQLHLAPVAAAAASPHLPLSLPSSNSRTYIVEEEVAIFDDDVAGVAVVERIIGDQNAGHRHSRNVSSSYSQQEFYGLAEQPGSFSSPSSNAEVERSSPPPVAADASSSNHALSFDQIRQTAQASEPDANKQPSSTFERLKATAQAPVEHDAEDSLIHDALEVANAQFKHSGDEKHNSIRPKPNHQSTRAQTVPASQLERLVQHQHPGALRHYNHADDIPIDVASSVARRGSVPRSRISAAGVRDDSVFEPSLLDSDGRSVQPGLQHDADSDIDDGLAAAADELPESLPSPRSQFSTLQRKLVETTVKILVGDPDAETSRDPDSPRT
jgi:hypothetical protein